MSAFDDREKAFEAKYHVDEEIAFKVNARRDKLLGLWVAEKLGLAGIEAEGYAREVVFADLADGTHASMLSKLLADLTAKGIEMTEDKLIHQMQRLLPTAHQQLMDDLAEGKQHISPE